jgi:hypothetical protein
LSLSTQSRANKPSIRKLTSSRRFDYLIVKERSTIQLLNETVRLAVRLREGQSKRNLYHRAAVIFSRHGSGTAADYRRG